jgi:hypothetical protein
MYAEKQGNERGLYENSKQKMTTKAELSTGKAERHMKIE